MSGRLAILAGSGVLPTLVAQAQPQAMFCGFQHLSYDRPAHAIDLFSLERLGALFDSLRKFRTERLYVWSRGLCLGRS